MIAYKVVDKETRKGTNWMLSDYASRQNLFECEDKVRIELRQYFPVYKKEETINAVPGTPGIICFESIGFAEDFAKKELGLKCFLGQLVEIIKVEGIGEPNYDPKLIAGCSYFYHLIDRNPIFRKDNPPGTVSFESVKVLE